MDKVRRAVAVISAMVSMAAIALALLGGGIIISVVEVFRFFGLAKEDSSIYIYPLGSTVFLFYLFGIALSLAALRWPLASGLAMLPMGVCAFLFGGPIAQVFGIVMMCAGGILAVTSARRGKA